MSYELSTYEDTDDNYIVVNSLLTYNIDKYQGNYIDDVNTDKIILPFNTIDLINTFKHTYKSYKEIYNQYIIDTKRTQLYHNNNIINTNELFNIISNLTEPYLSIEDTLSCCTQSVFYWPYKMIQFKYCNPDNYHLGELPYENENRKKRNSFNKINRNKRNSFKKYRNKNTNMYKNVYKNMNSPNAYIKYIDKDSPELCIFKKLRIFKIDDLGNDITLLIKTIQFSISLDKKMSILEID